MKVSRYLGGSGIVVVERKSDTESLTYILLLRTTATSCSQGGTVLRYDKVCYLTQNELKVTKHRVDTWCHVARFHGDLKLTIDYFSLAKKK